METIEERAMEKYWPDDFKQETVEKISTEVVSYITEQIESAINEKQQRSMGTIEERAKVYAPDPFLAALERMYTFSFLAIRERISRTFSMKGSRLAIHSLLIAFVYL